MTIWSVFQNTVTIIYINYSDYGIVVYIYIRMHISTVKNSVNIIILAEYNYVLSQNYWWIV